MMTRLKGYLRVTAAGLHFDAVLDYGRAPRTSAAFAQRLPFRSKIIHVRWSGEGVWIPLDGDPFSIPYENHTSHPAPGQFILYPGDFSEPEILLAYGGVRFSSKVGQLAGNHFLTLTSNLESLAEVGRRTLWNGAQDILFEEATETNDDLPQLST